MDCDAVRNQLGPYLDNELRSQARGAVEAHLAVCPACADELESLRALGAGLTSDGPASVPSALWISIQERLERATERSPKRSALGTKLRMFRRPLGVAASVLLVVGVGLLGLAWLDGGAPRAEAAAIHYGVLLDALPLDARQALGKFLSQYDARKTSVHAARRYAPNLKFAIPRSLPGGFTLEAVYTFRFGENPGVAAEYARDGELLATIFHPPVHPEDFGTHKDYPCVVGKHRGRTVKVGPWRMVHLTDPTTCHCVLSKLDMETELPVVMAAVAPALRASGSGGHDN